ncbi:hypothetical protein K435DRAFT_697104, partial [Dendrothele bispora CBS 962.96]
LNFWGSNIISTEGNEWKMHRRVASTAFNEANNALVWSETTRISSQWMNNLKKEAEVDLLEDLRLVSICKNNIYQHLNECQPFLDYHASHPRSRVRKTSNLGRRLKQTTGRRPNAI